MSKLIHEKGCWSGFVEHWVVSHSPSYAPEFDDEVCTECQVIRGELIPHPNNPNLMIKAPPVTIKKATHKVKKGWSAALDFLVRAYRHGIKRFSSVVQMGPEHLPFMSRQSISGTIGHEFDAITSRIQAEIRRQEEQRNHENS